MNRQQLIEILFRHWRAHREKRRADIMEAWILHAMEEAAGEVAAQAVSIYSEYVHSAEVIRDGGKAYMEVRLRWRLPAQASPEGRVLSIVEKQE